MTFGTRTKRFSAYDSALEQLTLLTIYDSATSCVYVTATLSHKYVGGGQNKMVDIIFIQENLFQNIVWKSFSDDILKELFLNENVSIPIKISSKFVSRVPINIIPASVQIMAWRRTGASHYLKQRMVKVGDAYMRHSATRM